VLPKRHGQRDDLTELSEVFLCVGWLGVQRLGSLVVAEVQGDPLPIRAIGEGTTVIKSSLSEKVRRSRGHQSSLEITGDHREIRDNDRLLAELLQGVARLHGDVPRLADQGQRPRQPLPVSLDQADQVDVPPSMGPWHRPYAVLCRGPEDLSET